MLDGFHNSISELPNIPERAIGELERQLQAHSDKLGGALSSGLADEIASNLQMLQDFQNTEVKTPELDNSTGQNDGEEDGTASTENRRSSFVVDSLDRGSEAALKAIFNSRQDRTPQQQLAEQKKTNKHLATIAKKSSAPTFKTASAVS